MTTTMMAGCKTTKLFHIFTGVVIGFVLTFQFRTINYENFKKDILFQLCSSKARLEPVAESALEIVDQDVVSAFWSLRNLSSSLARDPATRLLLIGVMTASKFIDTRAATIYRTWASELNGDIIFFTSSNTRLEQNQSLPLVALPNVDDSYPPQKKSFLMFKFLHDQFGDRYKFFMRADDDVFVNVARLRRFLVQLNSSEPLYFGQTGVGNTEEFGQLNLMFNENFCMGGPGAVVSHRALALMAPNIGKCLKNLRSTHEDVEIGRCIKQYAGVSCTWSYDMQNVFYHNVSLQHSIEHGVFPSAQMLKAITLHPIKDDRIMTRLYGYAKQLQHRELNLELVQVYRTINANPQACNLLAATELLNQTRLLGFETSFELLNSLASRHETWKLFTSKYYSEASLNPRSNLPPHLIHSLNDNLHRIGAIINKQSIRKGRLLTLNSVNYGYVKYEAHIGVAYILDLMMIYRKFSGKRVTFPVRRHAYAVQTFAETQIRTIPLEDSMGKVVNIVVPLFGRLATFERFSRNLIDVHGQDKRMSLLVVVFPQSDHKQTISGIKSIISNLGLVHSLDAGFIELPGNFSRARALQASADHYDREALLFFLDVDMRFTSSVIHRVRVNTQLGGTVYFPIVFSQYENQLNQSNHRIDKQFGYWRLFGFGIMSIYNNDLIEVGGFNTSINGWGLEDVNLYERLVRSDGHREVRRVVEPDLVHIYHSIQCDVHLTPVQYEMCMGTKLSSMQSMETLAGYVNNALPSLQPSTISKWRN